MTCNTSEPYESLKAKMDALAEKSPPEIPAVTEINAAIDAAAASLKSALEDAAAFLENATTPNENLQDKINSLADCESPNELYKAIKDIKEKFGEAVDDLDKIISEVTGGVSDAVTKLFGTSSESTLPKTGFGAAFDSDLKSAKAGIAEGMDKLQGFLGGNGFSLENTFDLTTPGNPFAIKINSEVVCDKVKNMELTPEGKVVEQPPKPVTPTEKPADPPEPKRPTVTASPKVQPPTSTPKTESKPLVGGASPKTYHVSDEVVTKLKKSEGFRAKAYDDGVGVWTIGYGSTYLADGSRVTRNTPDITEAEATKLLKLKLAKEFEPGVCRFVKCDVTQSMFDSLVHLCYNTGAGGIKALANQSGLNEGKYDACAAQMKDFRVLPGSKVEKGLRRRRAWESELFLKDGLPGATSSAPQTAPVVEAPKTKIINTEGSQPSFVAPPDITTTASLRFFKKAWVHYWNVEFYDLRAKLKSGDINKDEFEKRTIQFEVTRKSYPAFLMKEYGVTNMDDSYFTTRATFPKSKHDTAYAGESSSKATEDLTTLHKAMTAKFDEIKKEYGADAEKCDFKIAVEKWPKERKV